MKKFISIVATGALALSLASCSTGGSNHEGATADAGPLVIYSNSVSDGRGDYLAAEAKAAGFDIEFVDIGGADLTARVSAEVNNPVADVIFGPTDLQFRAMKAAGALQSFKPEWAGEVEPADEDGTYYSIVQEPFSLYYNDAAYPGGKGAPQDWTSLFKDPAFHGTYQSPRALGGTTSQMILIGFLARYRDDNGNLGISDEGWKAIHEFFEHSNPEVEGVDLYSRMAAGQVNTGQMFLAGKASREKQYGIATTAVPSSVGVPFGTQNVGIAKGSGRAERAKQFVDWFGSAKVQAGWSKKFFTAPTNQVAIGDADPKAVAATTAFKKQDIDWGWVSENLPSWIEEIELKHIG
ncbi:extracellular solute-binding protein [Arthrobacter sp. StoSoilB5]|uniref:extracellular solute-binding protein n=1 Tax=Arthrobacter sp. StoSoilB5 TaxID=2830992 RepID=UPI001CC63806|nr:extracellular solute-binding protein [Arthrobacter sp. StoSoilB5]BCW44745.1 iron ABC transporter substrate-binding protein [Arthrobacter sp. StoSoilB5]